MPRVLVIDDEQPIRKALSLFFARRQWQVDEAEDGATALDMLLAARDEDAYELVISDLRMPGVSGVMLHDHLAVNRPALLDRLVFSTGRRGVARGGGVRRAHALHRAREAIRAVRPRRHHPTGGDACMTARASQRCPRSPSPSSRARSARGPLAPADRSS
jgi:CheY-like chemotaxis protein